jgi:hypothetical protein
MWSPTVFEDVAVYAKALISDFEYQAIFDLVRCMTQRMVPQISAGADMIAKLVVRAATAFSVCSPHIEAWPQQQLLVS